MSNFKIQGVSLTPSEAHTYDVNFCASGWKQRTGNRNMKSSENVYVDIFGMSTVQRAHISPSSSTWFTAPWFSFLSAFLKHVIISLCLNPQVENGVRPPGAHQLPPQWLDLQVPRRRLRLRRALAAESPLPFPHQALGERRSSTVDLKAQNSLLLYFFPWCERLVLHWFKDSLNFFPHQCRAETGLPLPFANLIWGSICAVFKIGSNEKRSQRKWNKTQNTDVLFSLRTFAVWVFLKYVLCVTPASHARYAHLRLSIALKKAYVFETPNVVWSFCFFFAAHLSDSS